ncbi:MAG: polysaccharide pyruvyl transferase family protein [Oscillospiraceae bacterium]|nr:polysaccharide pyruvyl transferase family protein [Oscillospiraceae bacterium]
MDKVKVAITAASFCGNKGAAAMLRSSIWQLRKRYGDRLGITLMSTYPRRDREIILTLPEERGLISVIDAKPAKLLFLELPLAMLYKVFGRITPLGKLFRHNKMIRAYADCDMVIDEAGVAFVDSRGLVMNVYAFVCAAVPMLCGAPVCKYSQALGSFKNPVNRLLAKLVLPKMRLICARGEITKANLAEIGVAENVRLCADGAFTMPDCEPYIGNVKSLCSDGFFDGNVIGVSLSSVVDKRCRKLNIDYKRIMTEFIDGLCAEGFRVLIIANSAREDSTRPRNNDLPVCGEVYAALRDKSNVRYYPREMPPEELRLLTARCTALVASRFHAMIGALEKRVPVLLIGWSHKYREVLDMFDLGAYAVDYSELSAEKLNEEFKLLSENSDEIRAKIADNLPKIKESSRGNIALICEEIDRFGQRRTSCPKN